MKTDKSIGFELRTLGILIKRKIHNSGRIEPENVTVTHGWVIDYLMNHKENDVMQKDLERDFSMRRSTTSRILKLMEKNGMIERDPVDYDARQKRIRFTERAIRAQKEVVREERGIEREMVKGISEENLEVFFNVIEQMKENLK